MGMMTGKRNSIVLILIFLCSSVFAYSPYRYYLSINIYNKNEYRIIVRFILNTPSMYITSMHYKEDENDFLDVFLGVNKDGTYNNKLIIEEDIIGDKLMRIKHASKDFLKLDPTSQLQHLFTEITFEINDKTYILDLKNLDNSALRLHYREIWQAHTVINFDITEEFLFKYCIIQEETIQETSD